MGKPESIVENYFIAQCARYGIFQTKIVSPGRRGMPDRVAIANGVTVWVEMKAKDGHPSEQQKLRIKEINDHGGIAVYAYTKDAVNDILAAYFLNEKGASTHETKSKDQGISQNPCRRTGQKKRDSSPPSLGRIQRPDEVQPAEAQTRIKKD